MLISLNYKFVKIVADGDVVAARTLVGAEGNWLPTTAILPKKEQFEEKLSWTGRELSCSRSRPPSACVGGKRQNLQ